MTDDRKQHLLDLAIDAENSARTTYFNDKKAKAFWKLGAVYRDMAGAEKPMEGASV